MNIYISNLNFKVEDDELKQLFEEYGEVSSAKVITDKFTGKSRGFGFVEMPDVASARRAIDELNGAEHEEKTLTVNEARPRDDRPRSNNNFNRGGDRGGRGGYGNRNNDRDRRDRRW